MLVIQVIFWIMLFIVFYAYVGYGILLYLIVKIRRILGIAKGLKGFPEYEPEVTLFIAAYNEKDFVSEKIRNSLELEYPQHKLHMVWVTDGSDDGTPDLLKQYKGVEVHHQPQRSGKIGAMNRGMKLVKTPIVVFCDANTLLGKESIRRIVNLFSNPIVGCVSGEKRIFGKEKDAAAGAGEGLYWKYESTLKKWDAELYSVVGAAGELFAIRTELYQEVEKDTLLDDFIISLRVAQKGYTIRSRSLCNRNSICKRKRGTQTQDQDFCRRHSISGKTWFSAEYLQIWNIILPVYFTSGAALDTRTPLFAFYNSSRNSTRSKRRNS